MLYYQSVIIVITGKALLTMINEEYKDQSLCQQPKDRSADYANFTEHIKKLTSLKQEQRTSMPNRHETTQIIQNTETGTKTFMPYRHWITQII